MNQPKPDIHLAAGQVEPALAAMDTQRHDLDVAWLDGSAQIRAGEGGFGPIDTLVRAFRPGYLAKADLVKPAAERRQADYDSLIAAGRFSVEVYRRGDDVSALGFPDSH
ncbi:hypothetical protein [Crossiella sp. CA198]|uniref:hypothetical protein n=1 Tax=Crossiella sp. CA198 TaxID=3455607 RepID=UPI003F8CF5F3